MKDYIVSARKYRPTNFDTVIGQEALTQTLKNAIQKNKLAHAYLFCGPRGVGKTTCARIFAKTINCLKPTSKGEPCNQCESCTAFNEQRSYNIHELDAASNNSIENIREIIEQVRIPPQIGKYKVFIIDEVHMLSVSAFNAFLKTLEEPPEHVIFILATTEKHKILPTILSRCQIYDFNRITNVSIVNHLRNVANNENILIEDKALEIIAQKADGGMRDALSIFDQLVSFTNGNITFDAVLENLNILDEDVYFEMTDLIIKKDFSTMMLQLNKVLSKGFDAGLFINGLSSHFRNLLMSKDPQTSILLDSTESLKQKYIEQAKLYNIKLLYRALKLCTTCSLNYKVSHNRRLLVELTLLDIAQIDDDESCGRGPKKELKKVFNKTTETKKEAKKSETIKTSHFSLNKEKCVSAHSTKQLEEKSVKAKENKSTPKLTRVSIKNTFKKEADTASGSKTIKDVKAPTQLLKNDFSEQDLIYCWFEFAANLPIEQTAIGERMKNMKPVLGDNYEIKVVVENEQVESYISSIANDLLIFLGQKLRNNFITLKTEIVEREKVERAYTPREQFQDMLNHSDSLKILTQKLNLELI